MNQTQFQKAARISAELAARWFPHIDAARQKFGITKIEDVAMFIAQCGHESEGYTCISEDLDYSVQSLIREFVPNHMTMGQAKSLGRGLTEKTLPLPRQTAIANLAYHGRNGNKAAGDGWKYRGRGLIQITFLDNYLACGRAIGVDLVVNPALLQEDQYAAESAAWFYASRGCLNHPGDAVRVTQIINGGQNGVEDRIARYKVALTVLNA
jgi:putative chitinase